MSKQLQFDSTVAQHKERKVITPAQRLIRRIKKEFRQRVLIGDIQINEIEYERLIHYLKIKCNHIISSGRPINNDPIFATALVQVGIRNYNGNFWGHIAQLLDRDSINANHQGRIGDSFIATLQYHNKLILDKNERVNNILFHGFVSNHYAFDLFEFLFKFYNLDLERDIERNTTEMLNNLMEVVQRNDNTGRTYLLVKQTANAVAANITGSKIRFRRLLRLIDRAFWEQITPVNPVSRLTLLFKQWVEQSEEFEIQHRRYRTKAGGGRGRRSFSAPYLHCDFHQTEFKIKLPTQLIYIKDTHSVEWKIQVGDQAQTRIRADLFQTVTGFKTEELEITIQPEDIFHSIDLELICGGERLRLFKIKCDCIRFFDPFGDFLLPDSSLPKGQVYAFTKSYETPISESLIENEPIKGLIRSYFEFEFGDIVRLPDGQAISIGKKIEEGLLNRKLVAGVHSTREGNELPIYSASPSVLLKIAERRATGTVIVINEQRIRLFDQEVTKIELADRSGETGYLLNLGKYGCGEDGLYQVYIDVPNDRTNRLWQFVLIQGFSYEFDDAPYIFQTRGTIRFPGHLLLKPIDRYTNKNTDENSFNFEIMPEQDVLCFQYKQGKQELVLNFDVPALQWKFDKGPWQVEKPGDLWFTELPRVIYLKYPDDRISFTMDEEGPEHEDEQEQRLFFMKSKGKNLFECDVTRVRSWMTRIQVLRIGFLEMSDRRIEFLRLITRSVVVSCLLKGDFQKDLITGEFTILGKANYYVDVIRTESNEVLVEKFPLQNETFSLPYRSGSGCFKVNVFEDDEDDTGFGLSHYLHIETFEQKLTNPYDLQGKSLKLRCVKKGKDSLFQMSFSNQYVIRELTRANEEEKHKYKGQLFIPKAPFTPINITIEFPDLNQLHYAYLQFSDGYDDVEFLYDHQMKQLVKSEQKGLSRAVRYRRYESLYPEDYMYVVDFNN